LNTVGFKELMSKPFELSYDQTIELEGFYISQISLRLDSERLAKLNEILQSLQIEPLKIGDNRSEKLRLFIDKLRNHLFSVIIEVTKVNHFPQSE